MYPQCICMQLLYSCYSYNQARQQTHIIQWNIICIYIIYNFEHFSPSVLKENVGYQGWISQNT